MKTDKENELNEKINEVTTLMGDETAGYLCFEPLRKFDWIVQGFSTKLGGVSSGCYAGLNLAFNRGDADENVKTNWKLLGKAAGFDHEQVVFPKQMHTTNLRVVGAREWSLGKMPDCPAAIDGQVTDASGTVLVSYGADCPTIYLIDDANHAIGLCHSGWKGTLNSISADAVRLMTETFSTIPSQLTALIGPSICKDNYEVSADVAWLFIKKHDIKVSLDSAIISEGREDGKYQLDLWEANRANLLEAGLLPENIYVSGVCTFREERLCYSHRRTGDARGSMVGFLGIRD